MIRLLVKRTIKNKIYWLAILSALGLLLCSIVYTDPMTGESFTFLTLFYKEEMQQYLQYGSISIQGIVMGYGVQNYLWMFAPIIVGIPCVLNQRTERFVLFRSSKNGYFLSKYISNLLLGGSILLTAQIIFALIGMALERWIISQTDVLSEPMIMLNIYMAKRLWEVFCDGVMHAIPGILLAEVIRNKYLILCIPFVWNYFFSMFVRRLIPFAVQQYLLPENNPVALLVEILWCGIFIKWVAERRCDCGQK